MLNLRLAGEYRYEILLFTWQPLVMSLVVSFCAVFSREKSWMRSGTELSQCLRVFLPILLCRNWVYKKA